MNLFAVLAIVNVLSTSASTAQIIPPRRNNFTTELMTELGHIWCSNARDSYDKFYLDFYMLKFAFEDEKELETGMKDMVKGAKVMLTWCDNLPRPHYLWKKEKLADKKNLFG